MPRPRIIDIILPILALAILFALATWIKPVWVIGIGAIFIILVACIVFLWRYKPDIEVGQMIAEGLDDLPGLQDHAEAARKTT